VAAPLALWGRAQSRIQRNPVEKLDVIFKHVPDLPRIS